MMAFSPVTKENINKIESVQRKFTRGLPGLQSLTYKERLRRIAQDIIFAFKIARGIVSLDFDSFFTLGSTQTRCHRFKLLPQKVKKNSVSYYFVNRILKAWNDISGKFCYLWMREFKQSINENCRLRKYCRGTSFSR